MVGSLNKKAEDLFGSVLSKYMDDPANFFVISSDFCHWFVVLHCHSYFVQAVSITDLSYLAVSRSTLCLKGERGKYLLSWRTKTICIHRVYHDLWRRFSYTFYDSSRGQIHESIEWLDREGMNVIESQHPNSFYVYRKKYKNTICGRHPIAVLLHVSKAPPTAQTMTHTHTHTPLKQTNKIHTHSHTPHT